MILDALHKIANHGSSLTRDEARDVMAEVLRGEATDAQIGALLVALHMKGETVEEIVGFAQAIRAAATPLHGEDGDTVDVSGTGRDALVDTCGTGGDTSGTFNISTAVAFVTAGAGVRVAKHGNRSISSRCGSADVMEALGVNINLPPARLAACLRETGKLSILSLAEIPSNRGPCAHLLFPLLVAAAVPRSGDFRSARSVRTGYRLGSLFASPVAFRPQDEHTVDRRAKFADITLEVRSRDGSSN